ncbi:MAG: hypothetical protein ACUVX8_18710, partial [Candidatus Zipacnadales bacterium]
MWSTSLRVATLVAGIGLTSVIVGQNIYPDPSFEASGVPGVAHSGERSGTLKVDKETHWVALGGTLPVEPFATYRVTLWAKGTAAKGTIYAPYCYEWNNFEWSFASTHPIPADGEWHPGEVTFVSPYDHMVVHPLALLDCANAEAWVDDVVVEKIAEPEATMKAIMAKQEPSGSELELIARYLISRQDWDQQGTPLNILVMGNLFHERLEAVKGLLGKGPASTSADIACLLGQQATNPQDRRPYVLE